MDTERSMSVQVYVETEREGNEVISIIRKKM